MEINKSFNITEELKKLPKKPGCYIMHGQQDEIIYVGKAVVLYNRVRQYFQSGYNRSAKIEQMVHQVTRFEYIVTASELEALVLENNLIKEHRPRYNTLLKDDKTYPFIKVTLQEDFPRVLFTRQMKKDKSRYFGPYTSSAAVKDVIDLVQKLYKIRSCSRSLPAENGKDRPCLNYHMKQCEAPCQGLISREKYRENVNKAVRFLSGDHHATLKELGEKMTEASMEMRFEDAIRYRDLIQSIRQVEETQKITAYSRDDRDIIACAMEEEKNAVLTDAVVQVFFMREGKIIGREHFFLQVSPGDSHGMILDSFIKQYYAGTPFIPQEILVQDAVEDKELLQEWLSSRRGSKVTITVPQRGRKEKLVEMAEENARMVMEKDKDRIRREEGRTIGAVREIESWLGLKDLNRMEAFDISNISGYESVGSMVVYEKGRPKRSDYRRFKIKWVEGPNDYASMQEVLSRRFTHDSNGEYDSFSRLPDLLLMDGGRGQVNIALHVLEQLGLDIPVCGMVKDDHHRTRGLYYNNLEIPIDTSSEGFHLITRIQDEAHRFAIEFHRSLRSKEQVKSVLDDIPGIGEKRRRAILLHFKSIERVREASVEELAEVESMNQASAQAVYDFFREKQMQSQAPEIHN